MRSSSARPTWDFHSGIAAMYAWTGASPSPLGIWGLPPESRRGPSPPVDAAMVLPFSSPPRGLGGWALAVHGPGELLPGALTGLVGDGGGLAEGQLQGAQPLAQGPGVGVVQGGDRGHHEPAQRVDELAGLVQVDEVGGVLVFGEPALDGSCAHEVDARGADDLLGGNLRDVTDLLAAGGLGVLGLIRRCVRVFSVQIW